MSDDLKDELKHLEQRIDSIAQVMSAVADDMLRACFMFEELSRAGLIPNPLPWELCTLMVELQHAMRARNDGFTEQNDQPLDLIIHELQEKIVKLRSSLAKEGHA
jgi:archaellum component FlaC